MTIKSNYYKDQFMGMSPSLLDFTTNSSGQLVEFYEHPTEGHVDFVYALIDKETLIQTDFFETCDMMQEDGEYTPHLIEGEVFSGFQITD